MLELFEAGPLNNRSGSRPTRLRASRALDGKGGCCHLTESRSEPWRRDTPSRVLWAHDGLLLGNKFVPNPCLRAASLKGPTHRPFLPPFPSRPPGGLPAAAFLSAAPGPGAAARGGTRLGARATARTMTPFPLAAASSPTPPPRTPRQTY